MRKLRALAALVTAALVVSCGPAAQSNVDTVSATAASSTPQNVVDEAPDSASLATTRSGGDVNPASQTTPRTATLSKSSGTPKTQSNVPATQGDSIIGYDRVIRFPARPYPPASSTPTR